MNTGELADLLIQQNHIGSVIKVSGVIDTVCSLSSLAPTERSTGGTAQRPLQWSSDITCRNSGVNGREGRGGLP